MFRNVNGYRAEVSIVQAEGPKRSIEGSDGYFSSMVAEPPAREYDSLEFTTDFESKWAKYIEQLASLDGRRRHSREARRDSRDTNDGFNGRRRRIGFL